MDRLQISALLISLILKLRDEGSWCGETHVQKSTYFLQELMEIPFNFSFILYKHGPFSFELRDELTAMQADMMLKLEPQFPYGPSIVPGESSKLVLDNYPKTIKQFDPQIYFIANKFGNKGVKELEKLSTCLYVKLLNSEEDNNRNLAEIVNNLKPHISLEEALINLENLNDVIFESKEFCP